MSSDSTVRPDVLAAFKACRLWRTASDEAVEALARSAQVSEVPRGAVLATEGDAADRVGVMVSGRARVFYLGADGRQITFETLETGDPLAAVAALAGTRYPAHIEAATSATVAFVAAERLFELIEREPGVARSLVSDLANRVVNFTSVVQTLALDVPSRVARYVFHRSLQGGRPVPGGLQVDLGMKKNELAMALGTVPETLSRAFAKLKDDGILEVHGSTVTVLDVRALATLGSGYSES
ncbi:MAG TPA: Crp/Fnr family transcriptional regulator [Coriobacteriia bacterium]|nr:Crp/Fnr family transcriptional regulator [Coriobacteriia bacterium]